MKALYRFALILAGCAPLRLPAQTPMINFDAPLGTFDRPAGLIIYASNMPATHTYFVLPNTVAISKKQDGTPLFNVVWYGVGKKDAAGSGGNLTISLEPNYGAPQSVIKQYISTLDPAAVIINAVPSSSEVMSLLPSDYTVQPGSSTWTLQSSSPQSSVFTMQLKPLGVRALALSDTSESDLLIVRYRFKVKGVEANSSTAVVEHDFQYGLSANLSCKKDPLSFHDLTRKRSGCLDQPGVHRSLWCKIFNCR